MRKQHFLYTYTLIIYTLIILFLPLAGLDAQDARATAPSGMTAIGPSLTLQQAVAIAIKNNLLVNQADLQSQINRVSLNQALGNMLPSINGSASQNIGFGRTLNSYDYTYVNQVNTGNYGLNGNLTLFSGLQLQNNIKANRYAYEAGKMDLQQQKDNITLDVLLAYLQILSSQDLLAIAEEVVEVDKKQVDRLETLNKEGALPLLSNLSDLKGQYAGDQAGVANAVNNLETARINLFQLLNIPYKRDLVYESSAASIQLTDYQPSPDSIYQAALNLIPMVRSADLRTRSYQKALQATRGEYYPTLSFYGGISTNFYSLAASQTLLSVTPFTPSGYYIKDAAGRPADVYYDKNDYTNSKIPFGTQFSNNKASFIGLQLNIPILNYLRTRNNVKKARINLKEAEINAGNSKLVLQQNVEQAYQNMIAAYKTYKFYIVQAAAYAESFRTTGIRFNEGVINSDVYVIAKNNHDRANTNLAAAKYTYIFRTKVLDYYEGKLSW